MDKWGVTLSNQESKEEGLKKVFAEIDKLGLHISEMDIEKPWGASITIDPKDLDRFLALFYPGYDLPKDFNLSPKFLVFTPNMRLSWQVHGRRGDLWRVLNGPVGMRISETDERPEDFNTYQVGEIIDTFMKPGLRHQNALMDNWQVVAEIWVHSDPQNPSDEDDIRRIEDDFGRS